MAKKDSNGDYTTAAVSSRVSNYMAYMERLIRSFD